MGRSRLGTGEWGRYSGSAAREPVAGWFNFRLRLAEAQVLGGLMWLPPGMGGSFLLGLSVAEDLLFTNLCLGLVPGAMGLLSAASHLGIQPPRIYRLGTEPRVFSGQGLHRSGPGGRGAPSGRSQGLRDIARAEIALNLRPHIWLRSLKLLG